MARRENIKYSFSVEGETEKWYLEWLENEINSSDSLYSVSLKAVVNRNPKKYIKNCNALSDEKLYHICDVEGSDEASINRFNSILDDLQEASSLKGIEYILGYSNMTFELWIILHKLDYNGHHNSKTEYLGAINKAFEESFKTLSEFKTEANFKRCLSRLNMSDVKAAINRANIISAANRTSGITPNRYRGYEYYRNNPSLSIHRIVEAILIESGNK